MSDALPAERLRQYLGELKPEARALLISELERSLLRGDEMPGADLVLQELRRSLRETGQPAARGDEAARSFFRVLEPFIVDDAPMRMHPGRIARATLDPIWAWMSRDLLPAEIKVFAVELNQALLAGDKAKADAITGAMQDKVAAAMEAALAAAETDDKVRRRLASQIAVSNGIESAREMLALLKSREALAALGAQLPGHLNSLADARIAQVKTLLDAQHAQNPGLLVHGLVTVMSRLAASWQLIRLATKAADSDKAARVAATPYAAAVNIVLAEVERLVNELKVDLKSGRGVAVIALLKVIHDAARGLRTEMDLSSDSAWARRLAAMRSEISGLLKSEIESAPGRMRRLLRPRGVKEIAAGSRLDDDDVAEVEALISFVDACRKYAGELALNEMTMRSYSDIRQYLESSSRTLLEALRTAGESDRAFRQSQVEAAIRFGSRIFGPDWGVTIRRAMELAVTTSQEKKNASAKAS
jgi:hypothetical protein